MNATPEAFFAEFHDAQPGLTPRAFGTLAATMAGKSHASTYALLAGTLPESGVDRILDLACGDGHFLELLRRRFPEATLHGADLSAGELRLAAHNLGPAAALCRMQAQALPYAAEAFDTVTCHLALMLMSEPYLVLGEIARVLRDGGALRAIVSASPPPSPALDVCREVLSVRGRDPRWSGVRFRDSRWQSAEGVEELLSKGFRYIRIEDVATAQRLAPEALGRWLALMYDLHFVDAAERLLAQREVAERAAARCDGDGRIELLGALRCVSATKRR